MVCISFIHLVQWVLLVVTISALADLYRIMSDNPSVSYMSVNQQWVSTIVKMVKTETNVEKEKNKIRHTESDI